MSNAGTGLGAVMGWCRTLALALAGLLATCSPVLAVAYGPDSFLVASFDGGRVAVYDRNFVFQGHFDNSIPTALGLDFTPSGNVVAAAQNSNYIRHYQASGALINTISGPEVGNPVEVKVGTGSRLYAGTQRSGGIREFDLVTGALIRSIGTSEYDSVAVLPGDVLWAGGNQSNGRIDMYSINTGAPIGLIPLDGGQINAEAMFYSASTNTVLTTDESSRRIYERTTQGALIRVFTPPNAASSYGVTRGPDGDVFATAYGVSTVYRWRADGTFVGSFSVALDAPGPTGIIWAGNIPEPGMLSALTLWLVAMRRRGRR